MLQRFDVAGFSDIHAAVSADLAPVKEGDTVVVRPYRAAVGELMWLASAIRPDMANAARDLSRQSRDSCETPLARSARGSSVLEQH